MDKAQEILKQMPDVKIGIDSFYGQQTVLNALNKALNIPPVIEKKYTQEAVDILKQIAYREGFNDAEPSSR
tara:strand:+ start:6169 stop:6381 length:213 start_codon:yes stop_codon:yes gene_type:complete